MRGRSRVAPGEWLILAGILVLAAALRLVSLPARGQWDADQGAHMLVMRAFVADGKVPLVGPVTSFGGVHHGALYYDLLAPAAWLSAADPAVVVLTIVAAGVGAVAATWWLARVLGGPLAAAIAGGLMAVSATEVGASTFIWNPTLLPLGGGLAFAGAAWAWGARARWGWLVAAVGLLIAMQAHLLGSLLLPPLAILFAHDVRRTGRPAARRRLLLAGLGAVAILVAGHTQLILNELTTGFSETRAALAYVGSLAGGGTGGEATSGPLVRLVLAGLRILSWPFTGLIVDAYVPAVLVAALALAVLAWRLAVSRGADRVLLAWLAGTLAWAWLVLALAVPSLATVVRQLPVDHYHAFLDPLVVAIVAVGAAALIEGRVSGVVPRGARSLPRLAATVVVAALVAWNLYAQPPLVSPDGGWPAAERAAARVQRLVGSHEVAVIELPSFKGAEAYTFPLERGGAQLAASPAAVGAGGYVAVVCEDAFEEAIGRPCGGRAEDAAVAAFGSGATSGGGGRPRLVDRFDAAPGRHLSLYVLGR